MNNKFKGLYDNEKTSFITDRTNDSFYEPEIKTPRIQVHNYSINFDKKELYAEIDRLNNIINELEKDINNEIMMTRKFDEYNEGFFNATLHFYNKLKELKEGNNENNNEENN